MPETILENQKTSASSASILTYGSTQLYTEAEIREALEQRFRYRAWDADQVERGKKVTDAFIEAAFVVIANVPHCPTRTRVLNEIETCRMMANAAITHEGSF